MGHVEQIWSAEDREKHIYNYDTVFTYVKHVIDEADIAIGNLEVTLAGPPYTGYPGFNSPAALASACKNAGIDCMVTANNHSADRRSGGIIRTIHILDSLGIQHTGTFTDPGEKEKVYPLLLKKNGITIALLNYTYGTNGITVKNPAVVNIIDRETIAKDIEKASGKKPDIIIVFLHWGNELEPVPSKSQYELSDYLFEKGADIIIGSHPHVLQKMIRIKNPGNGKGKVAVYSLGNFVSNQQKLKTRGGAMARIEITKEGTDVKITSADYYLTWVYSPIEKYRKRFFVIPCSEYENKAYFFRDSTQYGRMKSFLKDSRSLLYNQNLNVYEMIYNGSSWLLNY
jgi:poly-gamma-glutamate synthesis protein (capsule biosynthesis protein)